MNLAKCIEMIKIFVILIVRNLPQHLVLHLKHLFNSSVNLLLAKEIILVPSKEL